MLTALYYNHHSLPFWHSPSNPYVIYSFDLLRDYSLEKQNDGYNHYMRPVLDGLLKLDYPLLANVSFNLNIENKTIQPIKRCWVQISSLPEKFNNNILPQIIDEHGKLLVNHIWGGDNGTYNPYSLINKFSEEDYDNGRYDANFWENFFHEKLLDTESEFINKISKLQDELSGAKKILSLL